MTKVEYLHENGSHVLRIDDVEFDVNLLLVEKKSGQITIKFREMDLSPDAQK